MPDRGSAQHGNARPGWMHLRKLLTGDARKWRERPSKPVSVFPDPVPVRGSSYRLFVAQTTVSELEKTMSQAENTTAAEHHEAAAKSHREAAVMVGKKDTAGAAAHAAKGLQHSEGAHKASVTANDMAIKANAKH